MGCDRRQRIMLPFSLVVVTREIFFPMCVAMGGMTAHLPYTRNTCPESVQQSRRPQPAFPVFFPTARGVPSHSRVLCAARDLTIRKVCASEYKLPRVPPTISENLAGKVRYFQKSELDKMPMHFIFGPSSQFGQETMRFAAKLLGIHKLGY